MSKPPGPISYPNLITDHHTVTKMREMIDHQNNLRMAADQTAAQAAKNAAAIEALPPIPSMNDIGNAIQSALIAAKLIPVPKTAQVPVNPSVTPPATTTPAMEAIQSEARWITFGTLEEAPTGLGTVDAGFLYFVTDYNHTAIWDGKNWQLIDGQGGYFIDAVANPGPGWQLCDGTTTRFLLTNTPNLAYVEYTTPKFHSLRHRTRKYFRR
jgi:hypothetical protein